MFSKYLATVLFALVLSLLEVAPAAAQARQCSAGANDGQSCSSSTDCPSGACVIIQAVCDGGDSDGQACDCAGGTCNSRSLCPTTAHRFTCSGGDDDGACCDIRNNCSRGTNCVGTQRLCVSGDSAGSACLNDGHCPNGTCGSTGMVCRGGDANGFTCASRDDCPSGTCVIPVTPTPGSSPLPNTPTPSICLNPNLPTPAPRNGQFYCIGGHRTAAHCTSNADCPGGACVVARGICTGGDNDGKPCDCPDAVCNPGMCPADSTKGACGPDSSGQTSGFCCDPTLSCGDAPCVGTAKICAAGHNARHPCLDDHQCPGSACVSFGFFCEGGLAAGHNCATEADCPDGTCAGSTLDAIPTCRPDQLPTNTPTHIPTKTPKPTRTIGPTTAQSPALGSGAAATGSSSSGLLGCAVDGGTQGDPAALMILPALLLCLRCVARRLNPT